MAEKDLEYRKRNKRWRNLMNLELKYDNELFQDELLASRKHSQTFENSQYIDTKISNVMKSYQSLMDKYDSAGHEDNIDYDFDIDSKRHLKFQDNRETHKF